MKKLSNIYLGAIATFCILLAIASFFFFSPSESGKSTASNGNCSSNALYVSLEDGKRIEEMITTIANTSAGGLLFKKGHLEELGDKINEKVGPFAFLTYIFSNPKLAKDMKTIQTSSMKYTPFVKGLRHNMMRDYEEGCFYIYANQCIATLKLNKEEATAILKQCIEEASTKKSKPAFKPFVDYLIKSKN